MIPTLRRTPALTCSSPLGTTGSPEVGSASTASMKRIALAFDTGCLMRLGGCTNIAELSPKVWQQTLSRTIGCRIPTHGGVFDNTSNDHRAGEVPSDLCRIAYSTQYNGRVVKKKHFSCGREFSCLPARPLSRIVPAFRSVSAGGYARWHVGTLAQCSWFSVLPRTEHRAAPLAFTHPLRPWLTVSSLAFLECFALTADTVGFFGVWIGM